MIHRYLKFLFIVLFFQLISFNAKSQYYITGQDPTSTRWMQIKTSQFRIVFPRGYDSIAQLYLGFLKTSAPYTKSPYLNKVRPVTIILHNQSTYSNAFVNPAPMHAEFFDTPSQEIYPERWAKQLSLHEYRHVVQMNTMRTGFGKFVYLLLGQQGNAVQFSGLPLWFIEGDAVYNETLHSNSGRGRTPDFIYMLKAQVLDKKIYSYDKAQFGSYKNFVPDHYTLGYQLVLNGILKYGPYFWKKVVFDVARHPYYILPFTIKMHHLTGNGNAGYYKKTLTLLKAQWEKEDRLNPPDKMTTLPTYNKLYSSYLFANPTQNGIIFEKSGLDHVHQFVIISKGKKEKKLFVPGFDFNESLSANDSLIVWNETTYDPRWSNRDYSDLFIHNYLNGKTIRFTKKQRLFAPALSPDGKTLVAVSIDEQQHYSLNFYDIGSHKLIHRLTTANNLFFMTPKWSNNGKQVVVAVLGDKGKSIYSVNINSWQLKQLNPFSFTEIKEPALFKHWLVYTGTYEGRDNLYVQNLTSHKTFRLFNARFGARNATFSKHGHKIYFSNYTYNGFKPAVIDFDSTYLVSVNTSKKYHYPIDQLVTKKTFILDDTLIPQYHHRIKKYSKLAHLFNPYSWGPFSLNMNNYQFNPGFSVLSQNNLSTAVTTAGYEYNTNEQEGLWKFGFDYYGWYPVIGFRLTTGKRKTITNFKNQSIFIKWNETKYTLDFKIPLNLTYGKWIRGLQPYFGFNLLHRKIISSTKQVRFTNPDISTFSYRLYFYNQMKKSLRDIYPKWGQSFNISLQHTPLQSIKETQFAVQSNLYFPGLANHHSLFFYGGYETRTSTTFYQNIVPVPRGYSNLYFTHYLTLRSNYTFPIAYPDWNIPEVSYLKRIYANVFFDYMKTYQNVPQKFSSTGIALQTDWNLMGLFPNISLGVRWNYLNNEKISTFDYLINVNF